MAVSSDHQRPTLPRPIALEALEKRLLLSAELAVDFTPDTFGSEPHRYVTLGNFAYFFATASDGTRTLYKTDGTPGGTAIVKSGMTSPSILVGQGSLAAANGRIYFWEHDPQHGEELWT